MTYTLTIRSDDVALSAPGRLFVATDRQGFGETYADVTGSDWTVARRADMLRPGDRFIFGADLGGEGEVLTVAGPAVNHLGTWTLATEELDFDLEMIGPPFVTMAPRED